MTEAERRRRRLAELHDLMIEGLVEWSLCECCGEWSFELDPESGRAQRWLAEAWAETFH